MGLLPIGINNRIVQWRAKERQVEVFVNDTSGLVNNLDAWDAYFYAKKYPIRSTADLDISIGYTSRLTNGFSFDLFPITLDISSGDYIYEIIIQGPEKEQISIVQDRFTILESLNLDYNDEIPIIISPSNYLFTVHDLIANFNLTSMLSWEVISFPEWLSISSELGTGNYSGTITKNSSLENQSSGEIIFKNLYNNYGYFDASFFYSDLVLSKTSITFEPETPVTLDISTANINSWITSGIPNWLSYDISKGIGNSTIILEASIISEKPVSNITVDSSFSYQKSFDVSFYYKTTLSVPSLISLDPINEPSIWFSILTGSPNSWSLIFTQEDWFTIEPSSGTGDTSINITTNGKNNESSTITINSFYVDDVSINLIYNVPELSVIPSYGIFTDSCEGTPYPAYIDFDVSTSDPSNYWFIPSTSSWTTIDISSGTGNGTFRLTTIDLSTSKHQQLIVNSYGSDFVVDISYFVPYPTDGLIGMWGFEDTLNNSISSVPILSHFSGDGETYNSGKIGKALCSNSNLLLGDVSTLMKGPFTLSMWFYPNDLGVGAQYLFLINAKKWNCSGTPLWLGTEGLSIAENITGSGVVNLNTLEVAEGSPCGYTLTELAGKLDGLSIKNNWHNIIFSMEANGTYHVFFDLQELYYYKSARTITGFDSSTMLIRTAVDQGWPFEGCIDQLQIFDRVLTSDERYLLFHGFDVI